MILLLQLRVRFCFSLFWLWGEVFCLFVILLVLVLV